MGRLIVEDLAMVLALALLPPLACWVGAPDGDGNLLLTLASRWAKSRPASP